MANLMRLAKKHNKISDTVNWKRLIIRRAMEGRRPRREARDSPEGALSHCVSLRASDSEVAQVNAGRSRQKESLAASPRAPGGLGCPVAHPEGRGAIAVFDIPVGRGVVKQ